MSILLSFDTRILKKTNPNINISDFTVELIDTIYLDEVDDRKWYASLRNIRIYNTVYNITSELGNKTISYKDVTAGTWKTITLPDGIYGRDEFQKVFRRELIANGDSAVVNNERLYAFNLEIDLATQSFVFTFDQIGTTNYEVRVDENLNKNLGFGANQVIRFDDNFDTRRSSSSPDINLGLTDHVSIKTSLVSGAYFNGGQSRGLFSFPLDNQPGTLLNLTPRQLVHLPCVFSGGGLRSYNISLVSGENQILDLQGQDWSADIVLERMFK